MMKRIVLKIDNTDIVEAADVKDSCVSIAAFSKQRIFGAYSNEYLLVRITGYGNSKLYHWKTFNSVSQVRDGGHKTIEDAVRSIYKDYDIYSFQTTKELFQALANRY